MFHTTATKQCAYKISVSFYQSVQNTCHVDERNARYMLLTCLVWVGGETKSLFVYRQLCWSGRFYSPCITHSALTDILTTSHTTGSWKPSICSAALFFPFHTINTITSVSNPPTHKDLPYTLQPRATPFSILTECSVLRFWPAANLVFKILRFGGKFWRKKKLLICTSCERIMRPEATLSRASDVAPVDVICGIVLVRASC